MKVMHWPTRLAVAATLLLALLLSSSVHASRAADSVLLSNIKSLTFRAGQKTSHRRVSAIPQLKCVGGSAKGLFEPDVMRCTNSGSSYASADVEWTCTATLPPEFKLGSTDVVCEGYSGPDDDRVLKGSCRVEYRLILTELGEEKYGGGWWKKGQGVFGSSTNDYGRKASNPRIEEQSSGIAGSLFWIVFAIVVIWMLVSAMRNATGNGRQPRQRFGGGGGGSGGGNDDPPPPYSRQPPPRKTYPSSRSSYGGSSGWFGSGAAGDAGATGWRPGFWTGAATGAAASYLASNRGQGQQGRNTWTSPSQNYGYGYGNDAGEGSSRRSAGSSGGGYSATRYESTGFGSTRRR